MLETTTEVLISESQLYTLSILASVGLLAIATALSNMFTNCIEAIYSVYKSSTTEQSGYRFTLTVKYIVRFCVYMAICIFLYKAIHFEIEIVQEIFKAIITHGAIVMIIMWAINIFM